MRMWFFHAHDVHSMHDARDFSHADDDTRFVEDGVTLGRRRNTELAMIHEAEGLTKLTKNLKQKTER